jgi:hypothetical protein
VAECVGERPVGELVVMTERLAIGGDAYRCSVTGSDDDAPDQLLTRQAGEPEREVVRDVAVVEDERDRPSTAIWMHPPIRLATADRTVSLRWRQDGESNAFVDERAQHVVVHRGLGEPHATRRATEPVLEVRQAPPDLRTEVAFVGERQDHVVVGLRDRASARAIRIEHPLVHLRSMDLEP